MQFVILTALAKLILFQVKTDHCRAMIEHAACRLQNGSFHDTMPLSGCHNYG